MLMNYSLIIFTIWSLTTHLSSAQTQSGTCLHCAPLTSPIPQPNPFHALAHAASANTMVLGTPNSSARVTYYCPKNTTNIRLEGGTLNRFGERARTLEDTLRDPDNIPPVTVAADHTGDFGRACNRRNQRCILQMNLPQFDRAFPHYRSVVCQACTRLGKRCGLPPDTFIGVIEDTGGAFVGKGSSRFDIAVDSENVCRRGTGTSDQLRWNQIPVPERRLHGTGGRDTRVTDLVCI